MNYTYLHYQIGLTLLNGIGPARAKMLLDLFGTPKEILTTSPSMLHNISGLRQSVFEEMNANGALEKSINIVEHMSKNNVQSVFYTDANYPRRLKQCADSPLLLYSRGEIEYNSPKIVSIVGTRNPTSYGIQLVDELVEKLSGNDIVVVSGLAKGIDGQVHQRCIQQGIATWGVLGHGLDRIYPAEHKSLASGMLANGGLITEFMPGTDPDRENFPMRNRIVAGLADATIVIESKIKGGSLITARLANDYNRDVFAFPGNIQSETSQGCNMLIQQNLAHILNSTDNFMKTMGWESSTIPGNTQKNLFVDLSPTQRSIVDAIGMYPGLHIDLLSVRTSLPITSLNVELFELEMLGAIRSLPGKNYTL